MVQGDGWNVKDLEMNALSNLVNSYSKVLALFYWLGLGFYFSKLIEMISSHVVIQR